MLEAKPPEGAVSLPAGGLVITWRCLGSSHAVKRKSRLKKSERKGRFIIFFYQEIFILQVLDLRRTGVSNRQMHFINLFNRLTHLHLERNRSPNLSRQNLNDFCLDYITSDGLQLLMGKPPIYVVTEEVKDGVSTNKNLTYFIQVQIKTGTMTKISVTFRPSNIFHF